MNASVSKAVIVLLSLILTVSLACNFQGAVTTQPPTEAPPPTQPPLTETELPPEPVETVKPVETDEPQAPTGAISGLKEVRQAVVRIEAKGAFEDPALEDIFLPPGVGSGFIIDPSGLALTNSHVVNGAASLNVWVGDESTPRNAKVVALAECADLALIDIDGEDLPYLQWSEDEIEVGSEIYIAGYSQEDSEYSLTNGIVSKASTDGDTMCTAVDSVVRYDALAEPGNSGGVVVNEDGRVLAVHYASDTDERVSFGLAHEDTIALVEQMQTGDIAGNVGINGQAFQFEEDGGSGIWVASVQPGSPAEKAGVKTGDVVVSMQNLELATDGSMGDYCDILYSHEDGETLSLQIVRFDTGEVLSGELNGEALTLAATATPEPSATPEETSTPTVTETPEEVVPTFTVTVVTGQNKIRVENNSGQDFSINLTCSGGPCQGKKPSKYSFKFPPGLHYFWVWPGRYNITWTICGETESFTHQLNAQWYIKLRKCK